MYRPTARILMVTEASRSMYNPRGKRMKESKQAVVDKSIAVSYFFFFSARVCLFRPKKYRCQPFLLLLGQSLYVFLRYRYFYVCSFLFVLCRRLRCDLCHGRSHSMFRTFRKTLGGTPSPHDRSLSTHIEPQRTNNRSAFINRFRMQSVAKRRDNE